MSKSQTETKPEDLRNVKVKALRAHTNVHGVAVKKEGTYIHPRPEAEIKQGLVELDKGSTAASKSPAKSS